MSINDDDYEDGSLIEDGQYTTGGEDYVVALGGDMAEQGGGEPTTVGTAPGGSARRGKRPQGW